jgi:hypothetical protein
MIITAKFASTCSCCRAPISVGSKIEWSKGSPARHVACTAGATALTAATTRSSYTARRSYGGRRTGCSCGSVEGTIKPSDCWTCKHDAE